MIIYAGITINAFVQKKKLRWFYPTEFFVILSFFRSKCIAASSVCSLHLHVTAGSYLNAVGVTFMIFIVVTLLAHAFHHP